MMPTTLQMQSISGIITQVQSTSGESPPPLVGASISVVGDNVYVFAGRLVTSRKMTNYMHILNLSTLSWSQHTPPPDSEQPPHPRYFHSASIYGNKIIVFGGMGHSPISDDGLCVLDDISVFDIETMSWTRPDIIHSPCTPRPRYAHLSTVTENQMVIVGGQDMSNNYLGEMNVLDLKKWEWIHIKTFEKHIGAYRSIVIPSPVSPQTPHAPAESQDSRGNAKDHPGTNHTSTINSLISQGNYLSSQDTNPIYLYTNYNFSDVKRELQLVISEPSYSIFEDYSSSMGGSHMPPGLRFPTGHVLGHYLILSGTYLSPQSQSYTMWALNLDTFTWSRIETGAIFCGGSWNRGVLHEKTNRFMVFGNRDRVLLDDYNNRQVNFEHVAIVDMEAFGIYKLPEVTCSSLAQDMGIRLLNEPAVSDFKIITRDNQSILVNSAILRQRWPYFAKMVIKKEKDNQNDLNTQARENRAMLLPYPYPVSVALLQFIYTDNLLTAQQYQPFVLFQLLLISDMYDLPRLKILTNHALHQIINMTIAPFIFEAAALSHQTSLQIRALKLMIAAKKMQQQQQQQEMSSTRQRTQSIPSDNSISSSMDSYGPTQSLTSHYSISSSQTSLALSQQPSYTSMFESNMRVGAYDQNHHQTTHPSPTLSVFRSRTPSLTPSSHFFHVPRPSTSMSAQGYPSARSNHSFSPPVTPKPSVTAPATPTNNLDVDKASMMSENSGSTHSSSDKKKERKDKKKDKKDKKDKKERKPFLGAFGNKLSMSFQ
ncbi:hypothetical protein CLU79DRAFT_56199 [Phycomyces nitens]|nr:hypothetical protein CLU79DRAFT_56199 [Phycomyces nitens]